MMSEQPPRPSAPAGRTVGLLVGGGVFALLVVAYIALVLTVGDRIPNGTTVAGVEIGGLGKSQAAGALEREFADRLDEPVRLRAAGDTYRLDPKKVGLELDADATVEKAYVPSTLNPITLIGSISGGPEEPVIAADSKALTAELKKVAKKANRDPREGEIRFDDGEALPVYPKNGARVDIAGSRNTIEESYLTADGPIALPVESVPTVLNDKDVDRALTDFARPAIAEPVTLRFQPDEGEQSDEDTGEEGEDGEDGDTDQTEPLAEQTVQADPTEFGQALVMRERGGELKPLVNPNKLLDALDDKLTDVLTQPEDARIEIQDGAPTVVPAQAGLSPDKQALKDTFAQALSAQGDERVLDVPTTAKEPELTTEELEGLGVQEVVGEFSTDFPYANYRNVNIARAAELMDGTLVLPGETFSMNGTVGERTKDNGFTGGYVIKNGNLTIEQGGGVSQVATTMYNASFFAGMEDVEHRPHGFYIDRYPVGREATLYWGSLDLRWKNTTPYAVHVESWADQASPGGIGKVTVRLWSTKHYEVKEQTSDPYDKVEYEEIEDDSKEGCVDQPNGVDGFTVDIERWLYRDGEEVDYTKDVVKYNPQNVVKCEHPEQVD